MMAVDSDTVHTKTDLLSVMRVHTEQSTVRAMRKGLAEFDAFDTGMYLCSPKVFEALDASTQKVAGNVCVTDAIRALVKEDCVVSQLKNT